MNLFFDLDGTLTNPKAGMSACIAHALEQMGRPVPPPAELQTFIGHPLEHIFRDLLGTQQPALLVQACDLYRERFSTRGLFENQVYDGIPAMLARLIEQKCYTLLVVTAKPTVFAERILEHFNLDRFFQGVYGSELDGSLVHKPDIIAHVLQTEGVPPESVTMIGDRDLDILGAREHGLQSLAVTWGFGTVEELLKAQPDLWAHVPSEIPDVLAGIQSPEPVDEIDS